MTPGGGFAFSPAVLRTAKRMKRASAHFPRRASRRDVSRRPSIPDRNSRHYGARCRGTLAEIGAPNELVLDRTGRRILSYSTAASISSNLIHFSIYYHDDFPTSLDSEEISLGETCN
jgi:hypothetical protein